MRARFKTDLLNHGSVRNRQSAPIARSAADRHGQAQAQGGARSARDHELTVLARGSAVGLPTELKAEHGTEAVERQPAGAAVLWEGSAGGSAQTRGHETGGGAVGSG